MCLYIMIVFNSPYLLGLTKALDLLLIQNNNLTPIPYFQQLKCVGRHDVVYVWLQKLFSYQILMDGFLDIMTTYPQKPITIIFAVSW